MLVRPDADKDRVVYTPEMFFETNTSILTSDGRARLDQCAAWLNGQHQKNSDVVAVVAEDFRPGEADLWSSPGDQELSWSVLFGMGRSRAGLLRAAPDWRKWSLFDCNPITSWVAGRVALIGDAAHPMLPF